jgi:hypothetical protein
MINLTAITRIMAKHLLHDLDVGPGRDRETRRCMPQLMRCQAVEPGSGRRCVEMVATKVEVAQDAAMPTGEYQLARYLPYDVPGKIAREKCWHRHRSPLVRLRRAPR